MTISRHQEDDSFEKFFPYGVALFLLAMGVAQLSTWYFASPQPTATAVSATPTQDSQDSLLFDHILLEEASWDELGVHVIEDGAELLPAEPQASTDATLVSYFLARQTNGRGTNS